MKHDPMADFDGGQEDDCRLHFGFREEGSPPTSQKDPIGMVIWRLARAYIDMARRVEQLETTLERHRRDSLGNNLEVKRLNARVTQMGERMHRLDLRGDDIRKIQDTLARVSTRMDWRK